MLAQYVSRNLHRGHLIGCGKKMKNYAEIFGNIMRKKVTIMRKRRQIMWIFLHYRSYFLGFFERIKYSLTSYREFDSLITCLTRSCHSWTAISSFSRVFVRSLLTRHYIGGGTLDTRSLKTRTQAHHQKIHGMPGGLKLFTNEKACFGRWFE